MKDKKLQQIEISAQSSPEEVLKTIAFLRERKYKEEKIINVVKNALGVAHDYVVTLYLEKALIYQHEVMEDRNMPENKQNKKKQNRYIEKMEESTKEAEAHVDKYLLERWRSRIHRFLGRISDYKKDYPGAIEHYKKAIKFSKNDPEYILEKTPRWLEYEAFMAFSILMSGEAEKGLKTSQKVYDKFINTEEGKSLKRIDYPTWAIWITGIPVRVGFWFIENRKGANKEDVLSWLDDAEGYLKTPAYSKKWMGKVDFAFRRNEINAIRRELV